MGTEPGTPGNFSRQKFGCFWGLFAVGLMCGERLAKGTGRVINDRVVVGFIPMAVSYNIAALAAESSTRTVPV